MRTITNRQPLTSSRSIDSSFDRLKRRLLSLLAILSLIAAIWTMVVGEAFVSLAHASPKSPPTEADESDSGDDPCEDSSGGDAADNAGSRARSDYPIDLLRGQAVESEVDLMMPSSVMGFSQSRTYNSGLVNREDTAAFTRNGTRWKAGLTDIFFFNDGVSDDIEIHFSASHKRTFTSSDGVNFTSPSDYNAKLTTFTNDEGVSGLNYDNDANTSESYTVYRLTETDTGRVYHFLGNDPAVATTSREKLVEVTSETILNGFGGDKGLQYRYDNEGRISFVTFDHPTAARVDYTYWESGADTDRIRKIELQYDSSTTTIDQKVEYFYWDAFKADLVGTPDISHLGSSGDLIRVTNSKLASDGSSYIDRHTMYRYYTGNGTTGDGGEHQLKAVIEPDAVQRILDSGDADVDTLDEIMLAADGDLITVDGTNIALSRFFSREFTYYTSDLDTTTGSVTTNWGSEDLAGKYGGANIDEHPSDALGMVKTEIINGSCGSCGGSAGDGLVQRYYYMDLNGGPDATSTPGINEVVRITIEDTLADTDGDGVSDEPVYRTIYGLNLRGKALRKATIEDPMAGTLVAWCESIKLGTIGNENDRIIERRMPSAHKHDGTNGVNTTALLKQFLNPTASTNDSDTLNAVGVIYTYKYNAQRRQESKLVQRGEAGTAYMVSATDWGGNIHNSLPIATYTFPNKTVLANRLNGGNKTTIAYTFWDGGNTALRTRTVTLPVVLTGENGSGATTTTEQYFDRLGRLRWTKDGEGYINYYSYDPETGGLAYTVRDIDPASPGDAVTKGDNTAGNSGDLNDDHWMDWSIGGANLARPMMRDSGLPPAIAMVSFSEFDEQGRTTKRVAQTPSTLDADDVTYIYYMPTQTLTFPSWDGSTGQPRLPIRVSEVNDGGVLLQTYSVQPSRAASTGTSPNKIPTGLTVGTDRSHYVTLTSYEYDKVNGRQTEVHRYHDIPAAATTPVLSTNYDATIYRYDYMGRIEYTIQTVSGITRGAAASVEQVSRVVYQNDFLDRVVETRSGVSTYGSTSHAMGPQYNSYPTLRTISKTTYDGGGVGDGHATKGRQYYSANGYDGATSTGYTGAIYHRTYRGHLRGVEPIYGTDEGTESSTGPYTVQDVRWDGRVAATAVYDDDWSWDANVLTGDGYTAYADGGTATNRRSLSITEYDILDRPYQSRSYTVAESNGSKGNWFESNTYYDRNNRVVAVAPKHQAATEHAYDGLGRRYQTRTVAQLKPVSGSNYYTAQKFNYRAPAPHPDWGTVQGYTGNDLVYTIAHTAFTDNTASGAETGLPTRRYAVDMAPFASNQDTSGGTIGVDFSADNDYVVTYAYTYYDDADRPVAMINHGTGTDGSGSNGWEYGAEPAYHFDTIPTFTSTTPDVAGGKALLTTMDYYPDTGRRARVTTAIGTGTLTPITTQTLQDDLGRTTHVAENHEDYFGTGVAALNNPTPTAGNRGGGSSDVEDRVTATEYDGLGNVTQQTAYNVIGASTSTQATEYLYQDPISASRTTLIKYPDGNTTTNGDNITIAYHLDGSIKTRRDPRGVVMTYTYTTARRQLQSMGATIIPAGVDHTIESIGYGYDELARVETISSYASNDATGTPSNQIQYAYNDLGQITHSYQSHSGAVNVSTTPHVEYAYDLSDDDSDPSGTGAYDDGARLSSMTYPDGSRQVTYDYLAGEADAVYERLNRVYQIKEGSTVLLETRSSPLGRAGYRELGTTTAITRHAWTAETDDGYDRFGRLAQMKYDAGASLRAQLNFGYDAGSNRLYREDVGAATIPTSGEDLDEFYSHDALSRLTQFQLGDVTTGGTPSMAVGDTSLRRAWILDQLGNWGLYGEDIDGGTTYNAAGDTLQSRQHNAANEIDTDNDHTTAGNAIDDAPPGPATSDWVDPTYDAAGNLTLRPDPTDPDDASDAHEITYDAWNRVVKIEDSGAVIAQYGYDGLSRRTFKLAVTAGAPGGEILLYYYNESWQAVEVVKSGELNPREQFVYDPSYIDALAVRWYDANDDGSADKQFYLYDESFSVIALTDDAGGVLERYRYTRYGERFVMDASFVDIGTTAHGQQRGFQGLRHDEESGLIENRFRMLDPLTGRFLQRDPGGYPDGPNAYAAYHVLWGGLDPSGLTTWRQIQNTVKSWGDGWHRDRVLRARFKDLLDDYNSPGSRQVRKLTDAIFKLYDALEAFGDDILDRLDVEVGFYRRINESYTCCDENNREQRVTKTGHQVSLGFRVGAELSLSGELGTGGCPAEGKYFSVLIGPNAEVGIVEGQLRGGITFGPNGAQPLMDNSLSLNLLYGLGGEINAGIDEDAVLEIGAKVSASIGAGGSVGLIRWFDVELEPTGRRCNRRASCDDNLGNNGDPQEASHASASAF